MTMRIIIYIFLLIVWMYVLIGVIYITRIIVPIRRFSHQPNHMNVKSEINLIRS